MDLMALLEEAARRNASDIHLIAGRVPIYEFLFSAPSVQQAIRTGAAIADLDAALHGEAGIDYRSRNLAIERLVDQGVIDAETAAKHRR